MKKVRITYAIEVDGVKGAITCAIDVTNRMAKSMSVRAIGFMMYHALPPAGVCNELAIQMKAKRKKARREG